MGRKVERDEERQETLEGYVQLWQVPTAGELEKLGYRRGGKDKARDFVLGEIVGREVKALRGLERDIRLAGSDAGKVVGLQMELRRRSNALHDWSVENDKVYRENVLARASLFVGKRSLRWR